MTRINMTKTSNSSKISANQDQLGDMIRKKAYELYEKRGQKTGHAMDDWLEAERIVRSRSF